MAGGRPTKYKKEFAEQAKKLCSLFPATDQDAAAFFGVAESTLNLWKLEHPEFSESLKAGKDVQDNKVEASLFSRATGHEHKAVKIFYDKLEGIIEHEYIERFAPDTAAAFIWLKNRRPEKWRDKQEIDLEGRMALTAVIEDV